MHALLTISILLTALALQQRPALSARTLKSTITGTDSGENIDGTSGDDIIDAKGGVDKVYAAQGSDIIDGGNDDDSDSLYGEDGDDTFIIRSDFDYAYEDPGKGTDKVIVISETYTLPDNVEDVLVNYTGGATITGQSSNNNMTGNIGNDTLSGGDGDDAINGAAGADTMEGDGGNDIITVDNADDDADGGAGNDTVVVSELPAYTLPITVENGLVRGSLTAKNLTGNSGNNSLTGNGGNNSLSGGGGSDIMVGGNGSDTYQVDSSDDVVVEAPGQGVDRVIAANTSYQLPSNVETGAVADGTTVANTSLNGTAGDNTLVGNGISNVLNGGAGNDSLDGGAGVDTLIGGQGNDAFVSDGADAILENPGEGNDTVAASVTFKLAANVENGILGGSGNNDITGSAGNNSLTGNGGNNSLSGGSGSDIMAGGNGSDTYQVDSSDDVVVEAPGQGVDRVIAANTSYQLPSNVETGAVADSTTVANTSLNGTAATDQLYGNTIANVLNGGPGNDYIEGGGGADTMAGGPGDDLYRIQDTAQATVERPGEGNDSVISNTTTTLGDNVEQGVLEGSADANLTGNAGNNILSGSGGSNTLVGGDGDDNLDGRGGSDMLVGGPGNDSYVVTTAGAIPTIVEEAGQGNDTLTVQASATATLAANVENLVLRDQAGAVSGTGNTGANILTGNSAANSLFGSGGNDVLIGGGGNDNLFGGTGADKMVGGAGNDVFEADNVADSTVENAGEGTDTVKTNGVTFTLPANVETGIVTGTASTGITGNTLSNNLTGNSGKNILKGMDGNDNLVGGSGNDTLDGGTGIDVITAGAGSDALTGGAGADTFEFVFGDSSVAGYDTITDFQVGTDKIKVMTSSTAKYSITGFSRAADMATATSAQAIASAACNDADGKLPGAQKLLAQRAAIVNVAGGTYKGVYVVVNKSVDTTKCSVAPFSPSAHLIFKVVVAALPAMGAITPTTWFV